MRNFWPNLMNIRRKFRTTTALCRLKVFGS